MRQITSIYNLNKREIDVESDIDLNFDLLLISKESVSMSVSTVSSSTISFTSWKIKQTKDRQLN